MGRSKRYWRECGRLRHIARLRSKARRWEWYAKEGLADRRRTFTAERVIVEDIEGDAGKTVIAGKTVVLKRTIKRTVTVKRRRKFDPAGIRRELQRVAP